MRGAHELVDTKIGDQLRLQVAHLKVPTPGITLATHDSVPHTPGALASLLPLLPRTVLAELRPYTRFVRAASPCHLWPCPSSWRCHYTRHVVAVSIAAAAAAAVATIQAPPPSSVVKPLVSVDASSASPPPARHRHVVAPLPLVTPLPATVVVVVAIVVAVVAVTGVSYPVCRLSAFERF